MKWARTLEGLRLASIANAHSGSSRLAQARTKAKQRAMARIVVGANGPLPALPVVVTLVRVGPRKLDDDNLAHCFKAVRDGVADAMGINDGDASSVSWLYSQERGGYSVRIEIAERPQQ